LILLITVDELRISNYSSFYFKNPTLQIRGILAFQILNFKAIGTSFKD